MRKHCVLVFLLLAVVGWGGEARANSRARRTGAIQSLGTLRKCEDIYYTEHGKYTTNVYELSAYTNITNTLKDIKNSKVHIEVSNESYTITAKPQISCYEKVLITATPDSIEAGEGEYLSEKETQECLRYEQIRKIRDFSKTWAKYILFLLFGFFTSYVSGDKKYIFFKICLSGLAIYLLLDFLTPNFY